jgi:hypothetical protein
MNRVHAFAIGLVASSAWLSGGTVDMAKLYETNCMACHTTDLAKMADKATLIAPPADEIMTHIKEDFTQRDKAVAFMADYILAPDPKQSHCASIETFGLMPSQKGIITHEEATAISAMMYDNYPRTAFTEQENKARTEHGGMTFEKLDRDNDGAISAREYQRFRAEKNNIDLSKFVNTYYFDRLDLNGDGKMDRKEFDIMKAEKRRKRHRSE